MYVDLFFKRGGQEEIVHAVERVNGKRVYKEFKPDFHFFVSDSKGTYKTIYGTPVKKIDPKTFPEKQRILKSLGHNVTTWEKDVDPLFRCIENNYQNSELPKLNVAFFDIETSWDKNTGWSSPEDASNYITAISVHLQWIDEIICLAIPPKGMSKEEAQEKADNVGNTWLFDKESEMLLSFLDIIEDADILSGWNSEFYDIPYIVNRIKIILGKQEARRMCLWEQQPKQREFERGGKTEHTYDLIGRVHCDYMQLYKKYNYEERQSYALNSIAEEELGENKVEYDGTLDDLYNNDFEKFLEYNIQDTRLLDRLDKKLQFIDLASSIAHTTCVMIQTTTGAVAVTDQSILVEAHNRGMVCPDKKHTDDESTRAAGAWVATPKKGFHKWVASTDMKSLYPSVIRALNMSPETIVGQIRLDQTYETIKDWMSLSKKNTFPLWWNDRFHVPEMDDFYNKDIAKKHIVDFEDGKSFDVTGKELHDLVFKKDNHICISANGTLFKTDVDGLIPGLLARWYKERKDLQLILTHYQNLEDNPKIAGVIVPPELFGLDDISDVDIIANAYKTTEAYNPEKLRTLIEEGSKVRVAKYMNQHQLTIKDGKAIHRFQNKLGDIVAYYDKIQLVKKIQLNSLYGAILNAGSRFFDQRIGQSTTLTGRTITKHMAAKTNEMITGVYDHYGISNIYGDTDSCYFSAYPVLKDEIEKGDIEWTKETVVDLYNDLAESVSETFPKFLSGLLNVPVSRSKGVIASSRETVSLSALFMSKKRYACLMYDKDGIRLDVGDKPGKVKAMGLDLKRADTPKIVQQFLSNILMSTLTEEGEEDILEKIREFKKEFDSIKPWMQGTPKAVNRLSFYKNLILSTNEKRSKGGSSANARVPGHVRASLAWNTLREIHRDKHTMPIVDGQKVIVCKLKETADNVYSSIAFPVDETRLPEWFTSLPFDTDLMMAGIVDKKIENLLGVMKWDLKSTSKENEMFGKFFG